MTSFRSRQSQQTIQNSGENRQPNGGSAGTGREQRLEHAAQVLGVSPQTLREALGPPPPDLRAAAKKLGVSVQALRDALDPPPNGGGNEQL